MKRFAFAATLAALVFSANVSAQESLRAEMIWFGNYTAGEVKSFDDPNSPTGKKHFSTGTKGPAANSDRIAIAPNGITSFGFGYRLSGVPNGTNVRTIHIIRFPGKGVPGRDGGLQETSTIADSDTAGQDVHIGWRMNSDSSKEYEGVWTFQVWSEQKLLLERKFTVYRP
jgi:hypothetical protein